MKNNYTISSLQLYTMLFLLRICSLLFLSPTVGFSNDLRYGILHIAADFIISFIIVIPAFLLKGNKQFPKLLYALYAPIFVFSAARLLSLFGIFYTHCDGEGVSIGFILLFMILVSTLAAVRGLEGISRGSLIFSVPVCIVLLLLLFGMYRQSEILNLVPPLYDKKAIINDTFSAISDSLFVIALPVLLSHSDKKSYKHFALWNTLIFVAAGFLVTFSCAVLGELTDREIFPIYSASVSADSGVIRRMDFVIMAIISICAFVGISMFLFLAGESVKKVIKGKNHKISTAICGGVAFLFAFILIDNKALQRYLYSPYLWICIVIISGVVFPFIRMVSAGSVKKIISAFLVAVVSLSLCSCSPVNELDEKFIIKGIGIDKAAEGYSLTLMALNTEAEEEKKETTTIFTEGKSIEEALKNSVMQTGKQVYAGQNLFIVVSDRVVDDIENITKSFNGAYDSRSSVMLFYCNDSAKKLLSGEKPVDPNQIFLIGDSMQKNKGIVSTASRAQACFSDKKRDYIMPELEITDDGNISLTSLVMFNDEGKCGKLTEDEITGYSLLTGGMYKTDEYTGSEHIRIDSSKVSLVFDARDKLYTDFQINIKSDEIINSQNFSEYFRECCVKALKKCINSGCDCLDITTSLFLYRQDIWQTLDQPEKAVFNGEYSVNLTFN